MAAGQGTQHVFHGHTCWAAAVSMHTQRAYICYLLKQLESHCKDKEPCSLRAPLLPTHVCSAHFLLIGIDVLNQCLVVHHETRQLPSCLAHCEVIVQCKAMHTGIAHSSKWCIRRWTGKERARHHGQLKEHMVTVGLREVQRCNMHRPLRR